MSLIDNYKTMINTMTSLEVLQENVISEIEEFFRDNDLKIVNVQLFRKYIMIQTGYEMLTLELLNNLHETYPDSKVQVKNHNGTLAILLYLQQ